jgi:hypothetical protein
MHDVFINIYTVNLYSYFNFLLISFGKREGNNVNTMLSQSTIEKFISKDVVRKVLTRYIVSTNEAELRHS